MNLSIETILKTVAEEYNLSPKDLKGKKRSQNIVAPRHIAMYLAREITEYSTTEIGQEFGRDHSTVITTCRKIEAKMQSDPNFYSVIENLKRKVREFNIKS
jgi:chromosomal replication initiator protein